MKSNKAFTIEYNNTQLSVQSLWHVKCFSYFISIVSPLKMRSNHFRQKSNQSTTSKQIKEEKPAKKYT